MQIEPMYIFIGFIVLIVILAILKLFIEQALHKSELNKLCVSLAALEKQKKDEINVLASMNLALLGDYNSIEPLLKNFEGIDEYLTQAATKILESLGNKVIPSLTRAIVSGDSAKSVKSLMNCAKNENDLLEIINHAGKCKEIWEAILEHPENKGRVLNKIATQGPIEILPQFVTLYSVEDTEIQEIANKRIMEEAVRRQKNDEEIRLKREAKINSERKDNEPNYDDPWADDEASGNGPCYCRWQ